VAAASITEIGLGLLAGSLSTLNPCVFPLLPLVLGGALQGHKAAPVAMGVGMATSFALLGLFIGTLGEGLGLDTDTFRILGGVVLIALALVMVVPQFNERFTLLMTPLSTGAQGLSSRFSGASLGSAFVLGSVLGLVWSPCSGPLLISALTLVASEGGVARGGLILGAFGLGAAIPLVGVAYASRAGFTKARGWVLAHVHRLKQGFAVLLGGMGVAILTGFDKVVEAWVLQVLPQGWLNLTTRF
jgi:cytochrome c biogenesis protein CcdA